MVRIVYVGVTGLGWQQLRAKGKQNEMRENMMKCSMTPTILALPQTAKKRQHMA